MPALHPISETSNFTTLQSITRSARRLTALIMAHGLSSAAHAEGAATPPTGTVSPIPPAVMQKSVITGNAGSEVSLPKFTEPLRDTPQSITVVPRQVMDDQGVTTLRDALRNVAGISIAAGEGGSQGDNLTLRGFTARGDIFLDAMRDFGSYYRDPFNLETVAALKGPESVMFGRGSTGGVINQESKQPLLAPSISGSLALGTDLTRRATLDVNEPVPEFGKHAAVRLNVMGQESEFAGRDVAENRRLGFAPSLSLGIGTATQATFSYYHQSEDNIPDYGVPWILGRPAQVERHNFYGFKSDYLKTDADIGTVKVSHEVSETLTLRDQLRYANYGRDFRITEPQATATISGPAPTLSTPLDQIVVKRNELTGTSTETFFQNQFDVIGKFDTGSFSHTVVTGIEASRETSDPTRFTWTGVPTTGLLTPDEHQTFAGTATVSSKVKTTANSVGVYAVDTLKLSERWEVLGGFRWDYFDADFANAVTGQAFNRVDEMPSWRGAVVFKPRPNGSIYFDYGTSFNPSAESLALSAGNANLPPEENQTFELGTKWDVLSGKLSLRGAIFRTEKTNARETNPSNSNEIVLAGKQRVEGLELEAGGRLTDHWRIAAGYALLDSAVESSRFFPGSVGYPLANVPRHTVSLWTTYELPWDLEIGGGVRYVGSRTASSTVPLDPVTSRLKEAPGYWTLDAMIKYHLSRHVDLQVNVYNLTNNSFYDQVHPAHIVPGAGISALFSTNFKF
jgi:catecholate siderophore receptor